MDAKLEGKPQEHAQSMAQKRSVGGDEYSIPEQSVAEEAIYSDFNEDAATRKVRAHNAVEADKKEMPQFHVESDSRIEG